MRTGLLSPLVAVIAAFGAVATATGTDLTSRTEPLPYILMIAIDDLNDWVGPLRGHPQVKTSHMDALAERGTQFTNAHCQAPLCNSSRTSLMTGLRPDTTGTCGLALWFRDLPEFEDRVSLPQHLAANGYRTYSTGWTYLAPL